MAAVKWTPAQHDAIYSRGKSIAVSAAAGSGKTAVLTRRIIERVCAEDGSGDISRILVVTFTKAAASELVSRISDALAEELAENPENKHIQSQSLLVSSAHISTIHSFCLDLIRTNFQKLNIPPDFSAADETEIKLMMQSISEELISDYFEDELREGENPIENFEDFSDMFGDVSHSEKLSETMISLYLSLSSTVDFLETIENFRGQVLSALKNGFDGSPWEMVIRKYLIRFLSHYSTIYADAIGYINGDEKLSKYYDVFAGEADYISQLRMSASNGMTYQELGMSIRDFAPVRLPVVRGVSEDRTLSFYKEARTEFTKELRKIADEYYSYSAEALNRALSETADALLKLSAFLRTFDRRFSEEKRRRKWITFGDMERYALALLWDKKQNAPTELALSLRDSFDEIYIDEYQDTNEIQDKIFLLISRPNNRFNVGDIKQSIYSFRGAEPSIFSKLLDSRPKYEEGCEESAVKIFLSENFRSSAEILDFCNGIFEKLMNTENERYGADERLNCGSGKHSQLPEIYLISKAKDIGDEEESLGEADFVAEHIADLLEHGHKDDGTPYKPSDIVILLRSASTMSAVYEEALKKRGIPCKNDASIEFFESPEVLLMLSLLGSIDNPARDIYLAAALKSPLYGITLDELIYIRRYCAEGSLFDALRKFTADNGFAKGKKFLSDYEKYALLSSETPCDALIWQIYNDTGIFSILAADHERLGYEIEQARTNLIMLYDYARKFERGGFKGLSGFISFINEVLAGKAKIDISGFSAPGETVNIMTIHKSKGLEFPVCFISGLSKKINFPEAREKTIYHGKLGITAKIPASDGLLRLESPMRSAAILDLRGNAAEEELRVLYVALTRAKEKLILTATADADDMENGRYDLSEESEYRLKNRYFSSYSMLRASSYFELLMTAAAGIKERFQIHTVSFSDLEKTHVGKEEIPMTETVSDQNDISYYEAKKLVKERLNYRYPYAKLSKIPSKLSVSKLFPGILDDDDGENASYEEIPVAVKLPNFLMKKPEEEVTAAEKGTAMHTFMQFCDFSFVMKNGVKAEVERLAEKRFIFPADKEKMDISKLNAFFESAFAKKMLSADRIYREKRFMIKYPASLFSEEDQEVLKNEKLLVQGVIDCAFFDENGELILVDYKTDFFRIGTPRKTVEKILRKRHTRQLSYYTLACEMLFGTVPAHTYIYSFAIDDIIEIEFNLKGI